jgi:hypothetical protein
MPAPFQIGSFFGILIVVVWLIVSGRALLGVADGTETGLQVGAFPLAAADPLAFVVVIVIAAITWGFLTARWWARHAAMAFWVAHLLVLATNPPRNNETEQISSHAVYVVLIAMYLYGSRGVQRYYERVSADDIREAIERGSVGLDQRPTTSRAGSA